MGDTVLERGREAASSGDWYKAYSLLREADAAQGLSGEDLSLLAGVAYAAGSLDATIEAWERAHAERVRAGDRPGAAVAATRVAMHLLFDTALMAPVRGWIKRAERLLENQHAMPAHAWLAVVHTYESMFSGNFRQARNWARQAIEVGDQCDRGAAAVGRIAEARSLVFEGEVERGLELLSEAAMATASGEIDPLSTGIVYCELVCALQGLAQYDLAEEWTQAMERWRHGQPVGSLHGRCRVHRAEILRLRGFHDEAEQEALQACEELRPYLRREFGWPLCELGQIRLRKGDLGGAEAAFLAALQAGWDPQPGLALLYLERGDVERAGASIRHALDHPSLVPSKELPPNTELRRAPLLAAQVEIAVELGELSQARRAAHELDRIAAVFGSRALVAIAATAAGRLRLFEGDAMGSRREFATALHLWVEIGAPYEAAIARIGLARACRAGGNVEGARIEYEVARAAFEQVGAMLHSQRADRACVELAAELSAGSPPRSPLPPTAGLNSGAGEPVLRISLRREGEYWALSIEGQTVRLRDVKGLRYLARLLAEPQREFHVLDLVAFEHGSTADVGSAIDSGLSFRASGSAIPMLDAQAKESYRRRLAEIDEDLEDARGVGDIEREERADNERKFLIRELSRAVGLGGRDRHASSESERARASVTRALRSALSRIRDHAPRMGEHFDHCVRTGTYCAYLPDPGVPVDCAF